VRGGQRGVGRADDRAVGLGGGHCVLLWKVGKWLGLGWLCLRVVRSWVELNNRLDLEVRVACGELRILGDEVRRFGCLKDGQGEGRVPR
jgi:hypothetical protein